MLQRIISSVLLVVLVLGVGSYYPIFKLGQWQIRKEIKRQIKNKIPEGDLHIIAVNLNDQNSIKWEKEGKEFRYGDCMYDVVHVDTLNGEIHYHCINDKEEKTLFARLDQLVNEEMDHGNLPARRKTNTLLKIFCGLIYLPSEKLHINTYFSIDKRNNSYQNLYHSDFSEVILHPPRV